MKSKILFGFLFIFILSSLALAWNNEGIVSWWNFDSDANDYYSLNNGTGSDVTEATGYTNNAYSFNGLNSSVSVADTNSVNITDELSISVWIKGNKSQLGNKPQTIISKWDYANETDLNNADNWKSVNLSWSGFSEPFFDGRYVYNIINNYSYRYDTTKNFSDISNWELIDTNTICSGCNGFSGVGGFDGRYIYYPPYWGGSVYKSVVIRYDTTKNFTDTASYETFDMINISGNNNLKGFKDKPIYIDGFVYFILYYNGVSLNIPDAGNIVRFNASGNFTDVNDWDFFSVKNVTGTNDIVTLEQPYYDGRYYYFKNTYNPSWAFSSNVLRWDTTEDWKTDSSYELMYYKNATGTNSLVGSYGFYTVGNYNYILLFNSVMMRFDLNSGLNWSDATNWETFNISNVSGYDDSTVLRRISFDGKYLDFAQSTSDSTNKYFMRYNTMDNFTNYDSWEIVDLNNTLGITMCSYGIGYDGKYDYVFPCGAGSYKIVLYQFDTVVDKGSYSLDYNFDNIKGLTFKVNVNDELRTVSYQNFSEQLNNSWHNVIGTYNGTELKIYLDGNLKSNITYDTDKAIIASSANLMIANTIGSTFFEGDIDEIQIYNISLTQENINAIYGCACPSGNNWNVNTSLYCNVLTTCNLTGKNITFSGTGNFTVHGTTVVDKLNSFGTDIILYLKSTARLLIGG